ncbi:MAG TPA: threonine--tRNA ligase [Anaerolineales bacterium]|nr:threonine--tRNA ligase [Anaerolineales bacterium]
MAEHKVEHYEDSELYRIRHSAAHVMAEAVIEMFPEAKYTIGPPIENGFYYDFDLPRTLTPEDLEKIEKRMRQIIAGHHKFVRKVVSAEEARNIFKSQPYKLELIEGLEQGGYDEYSNPLEGTPEISIYTSDTFTDLCRGPHVDNTGQINPSGLKLMSVTGAYWRGDEHNPMLQRVYGTAWKTKEELEQYLKKLEEVEARDHRRINKQLNLFSTADEVGGGLIMYGPKAGRIRSIIEHFWIEQHYANGYELLYSPHIGSFKLWETSGHLDFYRENMYSPLDIEGQEYYLKPVNCPYHMLVYKSQTRSYRDLPIRWAELGTVYRYERSGVLHGLMRVRGFTQDDAHIICTPEQMVDEIREVLSFSVRMWEAFGFSDLKYYLSTRPDKAMGTDEQWKYATDVLQQVLAERGLPYNIEKGGGAFYGPKIDIKIMDSLGREWQHTTIQFDFNLPERFDLVYIGKDGMDHRPYMVHRALLGSWERFFGLMIEHYAGAFPVWLCPVQIQVIPVSDRHNEYGYQIAKESTLAGLRVKVDDSSERMQAKIRRAQLEKIPYMLIVGDREVENHSVSVRLRSGEDLGKMDLSELAERVNRVIKDKKEI